MTFPVSRNYPAQCVRFKALVLRPLRPRDFACLLEAVRSSQAELARFMPWALAPLDPGEVAQRLRRMESDFARGQAYELGLFAGEVLASCVSLEFTSPNPSCLDVSFWTPVTQQHRGHATTACRLAVLYAFECLEACRVQMSHDVLNVGSARVAERVGFQREGVLRGLTFVPPQETPFRYDGAGDAVGYGLIADDLPSLPWVAEFRSIRRYLDWTGTPLDE